MKGAATRSGANREAIDQASEWFVEFRVGDADESAHAAFGQWLRRSPENVQAYIEIARTYAALSSSGTEAAFDIEALIALARSDASVINFPIRQPLAEQPVAPVAGRAPVKGRSGRLAAAACIVAVIAGGMLWVQSRQGVHSTTIGEQRSVMLADGSTIDMNALSRVRVRYSDRERNVELLEGQALFRVAKDQARPFIVRSGDTAVRAVGTQFDVYRRNTGGTTVTVVEGVVAVLEGANAARSNDSPGSARHEPAVVASEETSHAAGGASGSPAQEERRMQPGSEHAATLHGAASAAAGAMLLTAGEQVTIGTNSPASPSRIDVEAAIAWTHRRLVFNGSPLPQVAEEFNRYTTRRLIVASGEFDDFLISGTYSSTDPGSLLLFLRDQSGLRIEETDKEIRISRR